MRFFSINVYADKIPQGMASSVLAVVARVAYISSDVVVDRQSKAGSSPFADAYTNLSRKSVQPPRVVSVPDAADAASYVQRYVDSGLVSFTSASSPRVVSQFLPYLSELSSSPVVLQIGRAHV